MADYIDKLAKMDDNQPTRTWISVPKPLWDELIAVVRAAETAKAWVEAPTTAGGVWTYRPGWDVVAELRDALAALKAKVEAL